MKEWNDNERRNEIMKMKMIMKMNNDEMIIIMENK